MKLTCAKCFGNKTYRGIGSMIVKCETCQGSGEVEISIDKKPKEKRNGKEEGSIQSEDS